MKALFVHDHLIYNINNQYYSPGGLPSSTWSRYLSGGVSKLIVVTRGIKGSVTKGLILSSNENVVFDPFYKVKGGYDYYKYSILIKQSLEKNIKNVDVVIIRAPSALGTYAFRICQKLNKPYITEVVGCTWDSSWNYGSLNGKLIAPFNFIQMRKLVKNSFATLYVTECFLQSRYPTDSKICAYASNVQIPTTNEVVKSTHIEYLKRNNKKEYKIGILGNIAVKYKGYDIALKALRRLKDSGINIDFKFYIAGGGDPSYVESLIKKYNFSGKDVKIVGRLESGKNGVFEFLDTLDLYIHPSKQEGLPRAVIEAMSRACPVLASSVAGIPELIEEKYLHSPGDFKKLYTDIKKVLTNENERISMAIENFDRSKQYSQRILEERRVSFFRKAFSGANRSSF